MKRTLIWDFPTRLFHWLMVCAFVGAWFTADGDTRLNLHLFFGYLLLGMIAFRLVWGWLGGRYARFSAFMTGPAAGLRYLRSLRERRDTWYAGHNPAAAQAILMLLVLGVLVGLTGMLIEGGEEQQGALAGLLGIAGGAWVKKLHELLAILMLIVVFGHLTGVALGSWLHRENLPWTMVTGTKQTPDDTPPSRPHALVGVLLLTGVAAFSAWWFLYPLPGTRLAKTVADDPLWREECGACHLAYHPSLLPARSWQRLLAQQDQHFGSDLALDSATRTALHAFLVAHAAERSATEPAFKINQSIAAGDTPLRITETPYWVRKHTEIAAAVWQRPDVGQKSNCGACHSDAAAGTFDDAATHVPRP